MDTFVRLHGRGDIVREDGSRIERVVYRLTLWNTEQEDVTHPVSVDGQLDLSTSDTRTLLAHAGPMALRLEDGRVVSFTLVSASVRIGGNL